MATPTFGCFLLHPLNHNMRARSLRLQSEAGRGAPQPLQEERQRAPGDAALLTVEAAPQVLAALLRWAKTRVLKTDTGVSKR